MVHLCSVVYSLNRVSIISGQDQKIYVRCFHHSTFAKSLSSELSVEIIATENLLSKALRDHYEALTSLAV